jgi:hypothetical protein
MEKVAIYLHDMDGIFTAIEVKNILNAGFTEKYGILNYSEGWKYTTLDPKLINVVVDFANMPGDERDDLELFRPSRDIYTRTKERYKSSPVQKNENRICL